MKKILLSLVLIGSILFTPMVSAQAVSQADIQAQITVLQQLIQTLTQLINAILAQQSQQNAPMVQATGAAPDNVVTVPSSCSLVGTVIADPQIVKEGLSRLIGVGPFPNSPQLNWGKAMIFDWTLTNLDPNTNGSLYFEAGITNGDPVWKTVPNKGLGADTRNTYPFPMEEKYKAVFGDATCYASLTELGSGKEFKIGDKSQ